MQSPLMSEQPRFSKRGAVVLLGALALLAVCFAQPDRLAGFVAAARSPATVNHAAMRGQQKFAHVWPDAGLVKRKGDVSMMIDQVAAELASSGVTTEAFTPAVTAAQQSLAATGGDFHTAVQAASSLLASNAGDFGGYTIPIIGLATLAATIGILAGPVEE